MKVLPPFILEHSWCRGKNRTIRHTFMFKALRVLRGQSHYTSLAPKGFARLGGVVVWRSRTWN